jgi:Domain of unknown function (DUF4407)
VNEFLISVSGANRDILRRAPGDRVKHAALGGVLLTTAGLASISATFALHMAVHATMLIALGFGLAWGVAILNLDRWLVVATVRQATAWKNARMALPRLLFAIVIGLVVSTPLTLQIFQSEINHELVVMQTEEKAAYETRLANDPRYRDLAAQNAQIAKLEANLSVDNLGRAVLADPQVQDLRAQLKVVEAQYAVAEQAVICEKEGKCGSGVAGAGIAFKEKVAVQLQLQSQRDQLRAQLAQTEASVSAAAKQASALSNAADKQQLAELQKRVASTQTARDLDSSHFASATANGDGLLARLEALQRLTAHNSTLLTAHLALFALFTTVECLPVLFKMLLLMGKPSLYEELTTLGETAVLEEDKLAVESAQEQHNVTSRMARDAHTARMRNQLKAEVDAAQAVLDAQLELARRAVTQWRERQEALIDSDLDTFVTSGMAFEDVSRSPFEDVSRSPFEDVSRSPFEDVRSPSFEDVGRSPFVSVDTDAGDPHAYMGSRRDESRSGARVNAAPSDVKVDYMTQAQPDGGWGPSSQPELPRKHRWGLGRFRPQS